MRRKREGKMEKRRMMRNKRIEYDNKRLKGLKLDVPFGILRENQRI